MLSVEKPPLSSYPESHKGSAPDLGIKNPRIPTVTLPSVTGDFCPGSPHTLFYHYKNHTELKKTHEK